MKHKNHDIELTRRRYGKRSFFTWIRVKIGDSWQSSGDPVPKLMPSRKDLDEAISRAYAHRSFDSTMAGENKQAK